MSSMKISTARANIAGALDYVISAVPSSSVDPILSHVLVRAKDNSVTLIGTNHQLQITAAFEGEVKGDFERIVPADKLRRQIGTHGDDTAVKMDFSDTQVKVTAGRSELKLMTPKPDAFSLLGESEEMEQLETLDSKDFLDALNMVQYSAAQDSHRRSLNGVLFQRDEESINFVATDGHRMVVKTLPIACKKASMHIVPIKTVQTLIKHVGTEGEVNISANERVVSFSTDNFTLVSNTIQENYPAYKHVIPRSNEHQVLVERDPLRKALERVQALYSGSSSSAVAYMEFSKNKLQVKCSNSDNDSNLDNLDAKFEHEDMTLVLNASYLLQFLAVCKTPMIEINISSPENSVLIRPAEETPTVDYIVMPVRV